MRTDRSHGRDHLRHGRRRGGDGTSSLPTDEGPAPILVAVDGRAPGWSALRWAALEASARACPLRIVHVFGWPPFNQDDCGSVLVSQGPDDAYRAARALLEDAERRARQLCPTVSVAGQVEAGSVVPSVLRAAERDTGLLVIGRRRPTGRLRPTPWAAGWRLARRSAPPVVLVDVARNPFGSGPSAGRVVVAVEGLDGAFGAMVFAVATARRWGVGLTTFVADAAHRSDVEEAVRDWSDAFTDVEVRHGSAAGGSSPSVAEVSRGAALVVVGSNRRGGLHRALLGSLDGEAARQVDGPVVFVRGPAHRSEPVPVTAVGEVEPRGSTGARTRGMPGCDGPRVGRGS
jgi:nucleotide-binding universal stress UspA family protein